MRSFSHAHPWPDRTGAGDVTLANTTAATLGLAVTSQDPAVGVGETSVATGSAHVRELRLGAATLCDLDASVLPLGDSTQVFGKAPRDGIIGQPLFERFVIAHDFVHHTLTLTPPADAAAPPPGAVVVAFELPRQIPVVDAELDGVAGKFGIDTGARSALLVYGPFASANRLADKYGADLEGVTGWGIGGPVRSLLARAHELRLGGAVVREPVIRLSTQKAGATTSADLAGLIGPDVLSQFDVTFDYAHRRIVLVENASYGRADAYDRAGVWMGLDGDAFVAVDVIAGGPAGAAGLVAGDRIVAIDGAATAGLVLPEVRERMRRTPVGTAVRLVVERAGERREVVVTLRDLV